MKKEVQNPRKIVKRDITEVQFFDALKTVCQPVTKSTKSTPKQTEDAQVMNESGGKE